MNQSDGDNADGDDHTDAEVDVAAAAEIPEGTMKGVDVGDERVLLARVQGQFHAIGGLCTHQIAHLEDGLLDGCQVLCPRHGAAFDLRTGAPLTAPADMPVAVYRVRAAGGRLLVSLRPRPCPGS